MNKLLKKEIQKTFLFIIGGGLLSLFGKMDVSDYVVLVLLYMTVIYFGTFAYFLKKH